MPTVFTQVHDQAVCAGQLDEDGSGQGIGVRSSTCLSQCRYVIDVDAQSSHDASAITMNSARERFRNWSKFIDNSVVGEALLTEEGGAEQGGHS